MPPSPASFPVPPARPARRHGLRAGLALALGGLLAGPLRAAAPAADPAADPAAAPGVDEVLAHHAVLVHAVYADTLAGAETLQRSVLRFLARPDEAGLAAARRDWQAARVVYGQSEAFRFYGGPIDGEGGPEGRLNAWPMDEAYVDGVAGRPRAGLIGRRSQPLTTAALIALNERGGEENIATGWHAIEFMLWGQDRSATGPGDRPASDFIDGRRADADRRRLYLRRITELLVQDLAGLVRAWAPDTAGSYRAGFEASGTEGLRRMLVGLGALSRGELAGERLEVALASQDQEDEHSCFSDTTHLDVRANALGIENVWLGRYRRPDGRLLAGPGLAGLVAARDPALAERCSQQIRQSVLRAEAVPAPFDQALLGGPEAPGRQAIQALIHSLGRQSQDLVAAAAALGIRQLHQAQP